MPPRGYANGVAARGTTICVAGQIGWNERCEFASDDFVEQRPGTLTALFGLRQVREDDALRAALGALEVRAGVEPPLAVG